MDAKALYQERIGRFDAAMRREIPDRVPIVPNMGTWMYHQSGVSVRRAFMEDPDEIVRAAAWLNATLPMMDGLISTSNTIPLNLASHLGEGLYVVSDSGVQIKGGGGKLMEPEEYPLLRQDPLRFFANVLIPRKFASLRGASFERKVDIIGQAFRDFAAFNRYNAHADARIEGELGLPLITMGTNFLAPDVALDYLRDFVGISKDVRRCPDELFEACLSLYDLILGMSRESLPPAGPKLIFSPLHLPTYLRPKDFARLYLPFMKRYLQEVSVERGYSVYFFMENDWMPYLDLLQELPDNAKFVGLFETGDLAEIKRRLGNKLVVMGGMPVSLLYMGTRQAVIDKAKECLDTLAPGGGYIFSSDKTLLTPTDGKLENVVAACEYVAAHGKY